MSEQKRVPFQSLGTTKKEKKGEDFVQSYRFTLTLPESNEQACPEFNYCELLRSAEKKRKKENTKKGDENNTVNGLDPHDDDDDEKLQEMAKRFEAKYGINDYVDLGAGYDESDSFIDNTDAYDEIVPKEVTTVRGGFYINSGLLEFKTSERNSLIGNINNNNNNIEDESSASSEEETEEPSSPKQSKKRVISSSEEDEIEDAGSDHQPKKAKLDDNVEKNSSNDVILKKKKKQEQSILNRQKNPVVRDLLKVKREIRDGELADDQDGGDKKRVNKIEPSKTKSISEKKFDIKRFEKKASSNGLDVKKPEMKKIDDTIESVVNAARVEDQSSSDTMDSGKSRSIICSNSDCDEAMDKEESPLPDMLTEDMKEIINRLKLHAENSKEGKTKFFNSLINADLFSLERKLRLRYSAGVRLLTYAHLAHFLPCSKPTLVNRAKKLYLQNVEDKVKAPIERLKAAIDRIMPSVLVKYTRDCQRVSDENPQLYWEIYRYCWGVEGSPSDVESSDGEDSGNKSSEKSKVPQRRFPWSDETKRLVAEIAAARKEYFEILRPRKETVETFVSSFMDARVRSLWPPGWVRLQTLLKYSNPQLQIKRKAKKLKDGSAQPGTNPGLLTSVSIGMTSTMMKGDRLTANNEVAVINQVERDNKTPTNYLKSVSMNSLDIQMNCLSSNQGTKLNDTTNVAQSSQSDKKSCSKSSKDAKRETPATSQYSSTSCTTTNVANVAKISVVPTAQLMPPKSKLDKFNPMDLTSSSLSITPVNDYHKSGKTSETKELKKERQLDTISITPCPDSATDDGAATVPLSVSYHSSASTQAAPQSKPLPLKHRILHESLDTKEEKASGDKETTDTLKTERKEKREKRGSENRHRSHESKKAKKEQKTYEVSEALKLDPVPLMSLLSKEEQEQRQIEETVAATNFLSQIYNNDDAPRTVTEKRKQATNLLDEATGNVIAPPSEQENDVQMVMQSLKELEELQQIHSPVSVIQKPSKSSANVQYGNYPDDYQEDHQHLFIKKEEKVRTPKKEDTHW
ncbi:ubinuclein-1 isoform X1 [Neodiprion pinetum]|uniref:ubinuclein-1 isoform X1 n=1 Tax=Neodiprion pinetum TaxID=441929 RepID=UPI001EDED381|nr:ubinuclein-1 isoform X1 [Neodiprion pinetum]